MGLLNCKSFEQYMHGIEKDFPHKFEEYQELIAYLRKESQLKGSNGCMSLKLYSTFLTEVHLCDIQGTILLSTSRFVLVEINGESYYD